jgi:4-hydroxy-tetrahydrodipicolinate synthase
LILSGSICALATPFRARDDALDLAAFGRLIDYQLAGGSLALVAAGSTGEAAALDDAEYSALLEFAASHIAGRVPLLAGTGFPATRKTIAQTQRARGAGADCALVAAPAYVRPTQEGMYRHFSEIAEHGGLPVILYNVPSRTACDLLPQTVTRLARHGNIVGIKEALPDPARMAELLGLKSPRFRVLSGDDPTAARSMLAGADGVVSVAANVAPRLFAILCAAAMAGDTQRADAADLRLQPLYALLGVEPNPIPVKWCLSTLGMGDAHVRLPLLALSAAHHAEGLDALTRLGVVEAEPAVG